MKRMSAFVGIMLLATLPMSASTLGILSYSSIFNNGPYNGSATASDVLTSSQTASWQSAPGTRGYMDSYSAYASFGHLGIDISASNFCGDPSCGTEYQNPYMQIITLDSIAVSGADSGLLGFQFIVEGGLKGGGSNYNDFLRLSYILENGATTYTGVSVSATLDQAGNPTTTKYTSTGSIINVTLSQDAFGTWDYSASGTAYIPFTGGALSVRQELWGQAVCWSGSTQSCGYDLTFLNSALIGGAEVLDSNGNIVSGATITSASGWDYTQPIPSSTVPEPGTLALICTGLGGIALAARRRKK